MLGTFITKEIQDNILNLKFTISLILSVIITFSCILILSNDFKKDMKDYSLRISAQDEALSKYAHTNRLGSMTTPQKPPEKMRPLVIGIPRDANLGSFDDNPLPILFPPIDLIFIVTILMSLMAILFSYDAISGEREKGTLKLIASNSLSRSQILLAKWIGGTISLLIPFIMALLVGALYIAVQPQIQWSASDWGTFFILIIASANFIALFHLIGLLISTSTRSSNVSILTNLFVWVLLILIIPNISPYIASQLYKIPSVNKIQKEVGRLRGIERDDLGRKLSKEVRDSFEKQYGTTFTNLISLPKNELLESINNDVQLKRIYEEFDRKSGEAWREANRIQREKADKISHELNLKSGIQTFIAKHIACFSPYANYVYLATDLTGTGLHSIDYFNRVSAEFFNSAAPYLGKKVQEAKDKDPTFNSNAFIDLSDRPHFQFQEEALSKRLFAGLPYWGILLFFCVLIYAITYVRFIRYDVR